MEFLKWLGGGVVGAAIGAGIWVGASVLLNAHLGFLMIGVGVLTGLGVYWMSRESDAHFRPAILAVIIALPVGVFAKYSAATTTMVSEYQTFWDNTAASSVDDDAMIGTMADEVVLEIQERGETVEWPDPEMTYEDATWEEDYPPEIWEEGRERWEALSADEQQDRIDERAAKVAAIIYGHQAPEREAAFKETFARWDILWLCATLAAAFIIAGRFTLRS